jgi:hypothetical protein
MAKLLPVPKARSLPPYIGLKILSESQKHSPRRYPTFPPIYNPFSINENQIHTLSEAGTSFTK